MRYLVILSRVLHGASVGSTEDVIEADSPADAERKAIEAWKRLQPECTFLALFTQKVD